MRKTAFTLVELLIVIIIIGILATIVIPQYNKMVAKSKDAEAMISLRVIEQAELLYYAQYGGWLVVSQGYLDPNNSDVISFMQTLSIDNPNSNPARKWDYYFSWVDMYPGYIGFNADSKDDPKHRVGSAIHNSGHIGMSESWDGGATWVFIEK